MKIRLNYVSNSSSSSFVIVGKRIDNPKNRIKEDKNILVYIEGCGTSGDVGDWIIPCTEEIYTIIQHHNWFKFYAKPIYFECPDSVNMQYDDDFKEHVLNVTEDASDMEILCCNKDYSCPNNIDDLKMFLKVHGR